MKHIAFESQFVNATGNDLIPGKIHTIRVNYDFWKRFEGQDMALFTWAGKPYGEGSKHKVFCVKQLVSVQEVYLSEGLYFYSSPDCIGPLPADKLFVNDGFKKLKEFYAWFCDYKPGKMVNIAENRIQKSSE